MRRQAVLPAIAILAIPVAAFLILPRALGTGPVDDTFIFLRYAENFASGQGLVFNPGERVEGYTSPLWVLLLGALAALGVDLVAAAPAVGGLFGLATVVLVFLEGWRRMPPGSRPLALVPAWFLATSPPLLWWGWSGMETAAAGFLLALGVVLLRRALDHGVGFAGAGGVFAVAVLARPDALVALPVLLAWIAFGRHEQGASVHRKLLLFLSPFSLLLLHLAWRYAYYGTLLPNTYYAKAGVPRDLLLGSGLLYVGEFSRAYLAPLTILVGAGAWRLHARRAAPPSVWLASSAVLISWIAYTAGVGGDHLAMFRFFVPVLPLLALAFGSLLEEWARFGAGRGRSAIAACCLLSLAAATAINYRIETRHGGDRARGEVVLAERWSDVGRWLGLNVPRGSSLASIVIGAIPYYSRLKTYDLLGLADITVATKGKIAREAVVGHQKYDTDYILSVRPDYVVFNSSGIYNRPLREIGKTHAYALYDLANDPRTALLYRYRAVRMENGRFIEMLELKERDRAAEEQ